MREGPQGLIPFVIMKATCLPSEFTRFLGPGGGGVEGR